MDITAIVEKLDSFEQIEKLIAENDVLEIIKAVADASKTDLQQLANMPMGGYSKGKTSGCYYFVLKDLQDNLCHYQWLYQNLADERSKEVFLNLLRYRICPGKGYLQNAFDGEHDQYFDHAIVQCDQNEVFVDCGGYIGDTAESFIKNYRDYQRIYVYEPSKENIGQCEQNIKKYPNIVLKPFGVGKAETVVSFTQEGAAGTFMDDHSGQGKDAVKIVSLDEDIQEPVSFIKMDVEGFEVDALIGAKHHIMNDRPKLAICIYHIISDIWEIPRLIFSMNPDYKLYLRHYREDQNWETVIYAIPPKKAAAIQKKEKIGVYSFAGSDSGLTQKQLEAYTTLPLCLHNQYGYKAVMVGIKGENFFCSATEQQGFSLECFPGESIDSRYQYILDHSADMDIFILNGMNVQYFDIVKLYKNLRPDGKVYLALGSDSSWIDQLNSDQSDLIHFLSLCDVVSTSCKKLQKQLSIKLPFRIEHIPAASGPDDSNAEKIAKKLHYMLFAEG